MRETCIVALGSLLSFLLFTLLDISQPFNGFWKIKTEAFHTIRKLLVDHNREGERQRRA